LSRRVSNVVEEDRCIDISITIATSSVCGVPLVFVAVAVKDVSDGSVILVDCLYAISSLIDVNDGCVKLVSTLSAVDGIVSKEEIKRLSLSKA